MAKSNKPKPGTPTPPAKVTGVTATPVNGTNVAISWNSVPDATEYYIYRDGALTGIEVITNYNDNNGVLPNTSYSYQVAASIGDRTTHTNVFGEKSDPVTVTTPG